MANLIDLGLNVDSFNEEKKRRVQEFIKLFDDLSKYDGKVINPIMGAGLTEFNNSIKETNRLLGDINVQLTSLNSAFSGNSNAVKTAQKSFDDLTRTVTQQEKEIVALKLKLSETTREIISSTDATKGYTNAKKQDMAVDKEAQIIAKTNVSILQSLEKSKINQNKQADAAIKQLEILKTKELNEANKQQVAAAKQVESEKQKEIQRSKDAEAQKMREGVATKNLVSDYKILQQTLKDQAANYSNLYINTGKDSAQTKAALQDYSATAAVIGDIDKKLVSAEPHAFGLGKGLSTMYNRLRIISYVLPGIGMAGIFSLAFEAIQNAADELGIFNDNITNLTNSEIAENKVLKEKSDLLDAIEESYKKLRNFTPGGGPNTADILSAQENQGYDKLSLLNNQKTKLEGDLLRNEGDILKQTGESPETLDLVLKRRLKIQEDYAKQIDELNERIKKAGDKGAAIKPLPKQVQVTGNNPFQGNVTQNLPTQGFVDLPTPTKEQVDLMKKQVEVLQGKLTAEQDYYKKSEQLLSEHQDKQKQLNDISLQLDKENADGIRKLDFNTAKNKVDLEIEANRKVLNDDRSTEKERLDAIKNIKDLEVQLANIEKSNVDTNISSTKYDKAEAADKRLHDIASANSRQEEEDLKTQIEFYQRKIAAITAEKKDELDVEAQANLAIAGNEEKTLDDRLTAYTKYIINRQHLQKLELERDLQKGASGPGGKTSLTSDETKKLYADDATEESNIQSDAEKHVYDIVYSSLGKQLRAIIDANKSEISENKKKYDEQLINLNNSFDKKLISAKKYRDARKKLDDKYRYLDLDENVRDDENDLQKVKDQLNKIGKLKEDAANKVATAKIGVDIVKNEGGDTLPVQFDLDKATGEQDAVLQSEADAKKEADRLDAKLTADKLKRDEEKYKTLQDMQKKFAENNKKIGDDLLNAIKKMEDEGYEYKIDQLEKEAQIRDEGVQSEIDAVDKSSLTAKDKAALDIQLNAKKLQDDRQTKVEEKKLKIQEAIFDREMTIAHILWNTEQAVSAARALSAINPVLAAGLALQQEILGAIEVATVLATPIPSFKTGVIGFKGGLARYGEDGAEIVKEPYKAPYLATSETISYLPKGTDIIPVNDNPELIPVARDESWDQTKWLAKHISRNNKEIKNIVKPVINIDLGFEMYKSKILGR